MMVMLSTFQVGAKVFSVALLATTSLVVLVAWLLADVFLYFVYKLARRDLVYYAPGISGILKMIATLMFRLAQKVMTDFTGYLLMRGPYEMGGSYFAFNMVASQASCWIAARIYVSYYSGEYIVKDVTIYAFIGTLQAAWALTLVQFVYKIKRAYWKTFISTQSGRQCTMACFLDNDNEATKMVVFRSHEDLWSDIKDEVKEYTLKNWERWEMEKPAWFDDNLKALVPDECIPKAELDKMYRDLFLQKERRRSSLGALVFRDAIGGGVSNRRSSASVLPEHGASN